MSKKKLGGESCTLGKGSKEGSQVVEEMVHFESRLSLAN